MNYSQKYCLVAFLEPIAVGTEFDMADWPLHITIADVFAVDFKNTNIEKKIMRLLLGQSALRVKADMPTRLGETEVVLIDKTEELTRLHTLIVNLLESSGAIFNNPSFTRDGFLPHCTIQKTTRLQQGEVREVGELALVDMFADSDWRHRRVLAVYALNVR